MYEPVAKQKNASLILRVLKDMKSVRRSDLYKEVMKLQKRRYGRPTSYQVISRDVSRLLRNKLIKVVDGGVRSQILSLT